MAAVPTRRPDSARRKGQTTSPVLDYPQIPQRSQRSFLRPPARSYRAFHVEPKLRQNPLTSADEKGCFGPRGPGVIGLPLLQLRAPPMFHVEPRRDQLRTRADGVGWMAASAGVGVGGLLPLSRLRSFCIGPPKERPGSVGLGAATLVPGVVDVPRGTEAGNLFASASFDTPPTERIRSASP